VIIHGGKGKGKGVIFQYLINKESSCLVNIPYSIDGHAIVLDPEEYFGSIKPNTAEKFLNKLVTIVSKRLEWEGLNYYLDDGLLYFPNYNDSLLKKLHPSMSLFLPTQRHLYNSYTVVNVQDIERFYKIFRELQLDGHIKALGTSGFGYIGSRLPILRRYAIVKWRFHEKQVSAIDNILPFEKLGVLQRAADPLITSTASALREQYNGLHGEIVDGSLWIKKKHLYFDTRYYHKTFFGYASGDISPGATEGETETASSV